MSRLNLDPDGLAMADGLVMAAILNHLCWAALLFYEPQSVVEITAIKVPATLFVWPWLAGTIYLLVSVLMLACLLRGLPDAANRREWNAHLIIAGCQQLLLLISAGGSIWAVAQGAYLDGFKTARAHIGGDQALHIILALAHPLVITRMFRPDVLQRTVKRVWELLRLSRL